MRVTPDATSVAATMIRVGRRRPLRSSNWDDALVRSRCHPDVLPGPQALAVLTVGSYHDLESVLLFVKAMPQVSLPTDPTNLEAQYDDVLTYFGQTISELKLMVRRLSRRAFFVNTY